MHFTLSSSPQLCVCLSFPLSRFCLLQNWFTIHISVHIAHLSHYSCSPSAAPAVRAGLLSPASSSAPWFAPSFCNTVIRHKPLSFTKLAITTGYALVMYNVQCKWTLYSVPMGSFILKTCLSLYMRCWQSILTHLTPFKILVKSCFCFKSYTYLSSGKKNPTNPKQHKIVKHLLKVMNEFKNLLN